MSLKDDYSSAYEKAEKLGRAETTLFTLTVSLSLFAIIIPDNASFGLNIVITLSAISYAAVYMIDDFHFWYSAENGRRKGAIENSFSVSLTSKETQGYYNNEAMNPEIKYILDLYESCYFSEAILKKMLPRVVIKIAVAITALTILMFCLDPTIAVVWTQGIFSTCVLFNCVGSIVCYFKFKQINEIFFSTFVTRQYNGKGTDSAILKANALEYEAVKAHYKIRLNSNIFKEDNEKLSQEWDDLLQKMNPSIISIEPPT